jgi:hypothetical protein
MTTEHFDDIDDLIKRVNDSADDNAEELQHETKASESNGSRDGQDNSNANNIDIKSILDSEIEYLLSLFSFCLIAFRIGNIIGENSLFTTVLRQLIRSIPF